MASFSFGAGNAAKLARAPLYAAGRLATLVIPRSRDAWVFGCGAGIGDGALALWHEAAPGRPAVWLTGSAREQRDAAARGIPTVPKHSLRGFWRTARAAVVVVTHGFGDVNRYAVGGAFIVQLWHGIPLKRIGIDSPETVRLPARLQRSAGAAAVRGLVAAAYRRATRRIDLLPAASHLVRGRLESAFALPDERVPVTGEPRVDVLSHDTPEVRRGRARAAVADAVGALGGARLVLYAPTWRDGDADPAIPADAEWARIEALLRRQDAILLVRSHPLGVGAYRTSGPDGRVRGLGSDLVSDITPLLPAFDALVTDYSSIAFDAALVPMPIVYFAPDLEAYVARRGLYGRYEDVAGADFARSWVDTVDQLQSVLGDRAVHADRLARARALSARVHAFADGCSAGRVHRAILARRARPARRRGPEGLP